MAFRRRYGRKRSYGRRRYGRRYRKRGVKGSASQELLGSVFYLRCQPQFLQTSALGVASLAISCTDPGNVVPGIPVQNWTEIQSMYSEFRVLSTSVRFTSLRKNTLPPSATSGVNCIQTAFSRIDNTVPTLASLLPQYQSYRQYSVFQDFTRTFYNMKDVNAKYWTATSATPNDNGSIKLYGSTLENTTNYYTYVVTMKIQVRGTR